MVTVCWSFPIYSQTFVYRELVQLEQKGFTLCLLYSKQEPRAHLDGEFDSLWEAKRKDRLTRWSGVFALRHYRRRMPQKVARLFERLSEATGLDERSLVKHPHVRQAFAFTRLVEAWGPDYLHSYFFYERSLMSLVAAYLLDIPRGMTCYADHALSDYALKVVPLHLELCDIVIATSERVRRELLEIVPGADPSRILVKPNAIATARFPVADRAESEAAGPFRVVCVSRIDPKKGLLVAIEAMAVLRERGIPAILHLVGRADPVKASRDYERALRRRVAELGMGGSVRLEGRQDLDGVRRILASAHLFVAPFVELDGGDKDGIPTALLEAMATGLPAVVTGAGSILEVVEHGKDGVVVPQHDPEALAGAIEQMFRNPEQRRRMGRQAADKIRKKFDVASCEKAFHDRVLQAVTARRRR
jgi:glycosyltransferase involved in cell wall biosynthesis